MCSLERQGFGSLAEFCQTAPHAASYRYQLAVNRKEMIARALQDAGGRHLHRVAPDASDNRISRSTGRLRRNHTSILSGTHSTPAPQLMELLQKNGINDIIVLLGGTIPAIDIASLKKASIAEVFFPARPRKTSLIL